MKSLLFLQSKLLSLDCKHNRSIVILKCIAALLVINSHIGLAYIGKYKILATGGALADSIFFFCSGFVLMKSELGELNIWIKKRITRILPSLWVGLIIFSIIDGINYSGWDFITGGPYWFIPCIISYSISLWFIRKYHNSNLFNLIILISMLLLCWYMSKDYTVSFIYGDKYFKYLFFYISFVLGAFVSQKEKMNRRVKRTFIYNLTISLVSIGLYFFILYFLSKFTQYSPYQILSLIPLFIGTCFIYDVFDSEVVIDTLLYRNKYISKSILLISNLTLEIYIVHKLFITDKFNFIFPLNLLLIVVLSLLGALIIKYFVDIFIYLFSKK